jgi:hypothetical protein
MIGGAGRGWEGSGGSIDGLARSAAEGLGHAWPGAAHRPFPLPRHGSADGPGAGRSENDGAYPAPLQFVIGQDVANAPQTGVFDDKNMYRTAA